MINQDDDWVGGTPPEGHVTRDRSDPDFWRAQYRKQMGFAGAGLLVVIVVLVVAIVLA